LKQKNIQRGRSNAFSREVGSFVGRRLETRKRYDCGAWEGKHVRQTQTDTDTDTSLYNIGSALYESARDGIKWRWERQKCGANAVKCAKRGSLTCTVKCDILTLGAPLKYFHYGIFLSIKSLILRGRVKQDGEEQTVTEKSLLGGWFIPNLDVCILR
jgi:hypothetical protein